MSKILPAAVLALSLLAGCATPPPEPPPATSTSCDAEAAQRYVGQPATSATVEAARKAAGAEVVRTIKPGQMVTMEYRDGRLNLHVDGANRILRATCG